VGGEEFPLADVERIRDVRRRQKERLADVE